MRIWCGVTGHGYGHFMQVAPILNQWHRQMGAPVLHMVAALPRPLMGQKLLSPFTLDPRPRDVGLVQQDPLLLDLAGTLEAVGQLQRQHHELLEREVAEMAAFRPDLVLVDIPCLPLEAAKILGVPSVAVASLTWDRVLASALPLNLPQVAGWCREMRRAYGLATLALLPEPAMWEDHPFPRAVGVGPMVEPGMRKGEALRRILGRSEPMVLVTMGGIPSQSVPLAAMAREKRVTWLLDGEVSRLGEHVRPISSLPGWSFPDLVASVDGVVGKPGYGLSTLVAASGTPFLFVRRGWFADEESIISWLAARLPVVELTREAFHGGAWFEALTPLLERERRIPPPTHGPEEAVERIREVLG